MKRLLLFATLALLLLPALAIARPGGGEGFSGGGDGGGGGDGAGELVFFLLRLWFEFVIRYPAIGVPLTIAGIVVFVAWKRRKGKAGSQNWDLTPKPIAPPSRPRSVDLDAIRQLDPQFSVVLFEDFAYALYARAHQARSDRRSLDALAPYLSAPVRDHLQQRAPAGEPVTSVVAGVLRVADLALPHPPVGGQAGWVQVILEIESNLTLGDGGAQYVRERWTFIRSSTAQTKPPELVKSFKCPKCGAPFDPAGAAAGDRCGYCGEVVSGGRFDWTVQSIQLLRVEARPPALTSTVEEVGTSWPTVYHPEVRNRRAELLRDDPATTDETLGARLRLIYDQLNASWTALDLRPARPFVSDGLFDYLQYWIAAYQRQGLRNVLEGMRMTEWTIAKVVRDSHFDSVTCRLWGSGRDYTVRQADNGLVSGNPKRDRLYSEYWTLIRAAGVHAAPRTDPSCPNCGAPVDQVNMAGECGHCGAKITRGDFDWVLSKIEQDDVYTG
ncbi:MAG TPA: zinc-ribbon domain-containing transport protein [Thermoanaerobaculia bacterium]|nr:zinc-ribbon domain-containing transport protein [Thermoanaerobaculia bacterium]